VSCCSCTGTSASVCTGCVVSATLVPLTGSVTSVLVGGGGSMRRLFAALPVSASSWAVGAVSAGCDTGGIAGRSPSPWVSMFEDAGVGRGSAAVGVGSWDVLGTSAAGAASGTLDVGAGTGWAVGSWVAAGVGSWEGAAPSALDDSGSGGVLCASTAGGVGSGAAGLAAGAAAPGRRRAALGANFLPVVFSATVQHSRRTSLARIRTLDEAAREGRGLRSRRFVGGTRGRLGSALLRRHVGDRRARRAGVIARSKFWWGASRRARLTCFHGCTSAPLGRAPILQSIQGQRRLSPHPRLTRPPAIRSFSPARPSAPCIRSFAALCPSQRRVSPPCPRNTPSPPR
jgi:hypothetical protein